MNLKIVEKKDDKIVVKVEGETHTLLNLLRSNAWMSGATQASYTIKHPYLSQPEITIIAKNPKKVLADAAQLVVDEAGEFIKEFSKASK